MLRAEPRHARVLIVDDQEVNVLLLERLLERDGYTNVRHTTDPRQVLFLYLEFRPDIVLLDLQMPHLDGFAVMTQLRTRIEADSFVPILVLTADITSETKLRALAAGATDFLVKPFDSAEVLLRIRNLLEMRRLHLSLTEHNQLLEQRVAERTRALEDAHIETLERLAVAAEYRDDTTGRHARRVSALSARLAERLGVPALTVKLIERAAPLHDVGKISVPDSVLLKPGRLTPAEFEIMKTHTVVGAKILSGSDHPLLRLAEQIALTHHERWDGTGYAGLRGEAIPIAGRIVCLVDTFDALMHERPYKPAWPFEQAMAEIERQGGRQFDPAIVQAFVGLEPVLRAVG
jgi:putative two-component system response regulator